MGSTPKKRVPSDDRTIPSDYLGQLEPKFHCLGWNAKRQKYCKNRAGKNTEHFGVGRCWIHGGRNPTKHGRYSTILSLRLSELIAAHASDENPLDLQPELAAARAMLQDYLERRGEDEDAEGLAEGIRLVDRIAGIVEKIERIKAQNAITPSELNRLMLNMGLVVRQHVTDDAACARIQDGWLALRV